MTCECGSDEFGTVAYIIYNPPGRGWHPGCLNCGKMVVSSTGCGWRDHDECNKTKGAA